MRRESEFNPIDKKNMEIDRFYLALKACPGGKKVLEIGGAAGVWTHAVLSWPSVDNRTAVEINQGYKTVMEKESEV